MTAVRWTDVGPRDGLQNLPDAVPTEVKVRLVRGLLDAGAPRVEATSFVSPTWVPQLADAADLLRALGADALPRLRVLIPNLRGLELALEHGVGNVLVTIGATESFNRRNVNRSVAESLDGVSDIVALASRHGVVVDCALSVSFGCPFEGAVDPSRVVKICADLARRGVEEIGVADTIGVADPLQVRELVERVAEVVPIERVSVHFHDTRGMGVANVVSAYDAGVTNFEGSVGGLGGCPFAPRSTGNVASEDSLQALQRIGAEVAVDLDAYCAVAERLGADLGMQLPGKLHRAGVWHPERIGAAPAEQVRA
jgi:hydroxymethylglutaryl-CoA lyase